MKSIGNHASNSSQSPSSTTDIPSTPELVPRLVSGSIGSIVTALAVTPLEVAKIRQQASIGNDHAASATHYNTSHLNCRSQHHFDPCSRVRRGNPTNFHGLSGFGSTKSNSSRTRIFSRLFESMSYSPSTESSSRPVGAFQTLRHIFKNEGISGLYAGLRPTLIMSVPSTVLHLASYDEISSILRHYHQSSSSSECNLGQAYIPIVAGSIARLLSSFATAPLELIRTRQASSIGSSAVAVASHPGVIEEVRFLIRSSGVSSLYAGLGATLWRDVPFAAVYWSSLEQFKSALSQSEYLGVWGGKFYLDRDLKTPPSIEFLHAFISGAGAGAVAGMLTTPFDVVKTRRQMVGASRSDAHLGALAHMQRIVQNEGIGGLWRGNQTRLMKLVPAYAIMISCYELGKRLCGELYLS
ncbi:hypothetical protein ACHAXS_010623 [Conticribra weissflogii]